MAVLLAVMLTVCILPGCSEKQENKQKGGGEEKELTIMVENNVSLAGFDAVTKLAKEKLGIDIVVETRQGGSEGDNLIKTRLAAGEMTDMVVVTPGSVLETLNPTEYFMDISEEEWVDKLDDEYKKTVTFDGETFGVPFASSKCGAVIYSKPLYEKYNLEVPKTWDEFMDNCKVLKEAGETAILGTSGTMWTNQVGFLGNAYNILYEDPEFPANLEAGQAKWAETPAALRSFEKMEDTVGFYNEDALATTFNDGCDIMANGEAGHWFMLSQALSNVYELYDEGVNDLGVFAIPGDTEEETGLTMWMPISICGNKNSEKQELIKEFMEFYISEEALDTYADVVPPDGPYCVKDYELPENSYDAVKIDMQKYVEEGKTNVALEFLTSVKGAECDVICQELLSGQTTALEAAEKYDADCAKMATQLGLDWE